MRESAFRTFLAARIGARSIDSYVAIGSRLERELGVDLELCDLEESALVEVRRELESRGVPPKTVGNLLSVARAYARFRSQPGEDDSSSGALMERPAPRPRNPGKPPVREPPPPERPALLQGATVRALLITHGQILEELRERGVVRTGNAPAGDYAELLFSRAFGWTLAGNSSAGYDAEDEDGVRYQIKCRRVTPRNASRQLSAIRRLETRAFQVLAGVIFDERYAVRRAALVPHDVVVSQSRWMSHTNAWRFLLEDRVWDLPGVRDVTEQIRAAAQTVV